MAGLVVSSADVLTVPVVVAYLRACQDAVWFASLKHAQTRRDAHQEVLDSATDLLDLLVDEGAAEALMQQILAIRKQQSSASVRAPAA